jgi:hypothetical protein
MLKTPIARIGDVIVVKSKSTQYDAYQGVVISAELKDDVWTYKMKNTEAVESDIVGVFAVTRQYYQVTQ